MSIEKILICDDEVLIRNFLAETLKRKNFDVHTAADGKEAIAILKEESFDLVITDMKMPNATGIEVLKKVKEISPQTCVIVITAFGSIENAVEAMRLGAFNYLIKPFSPDTIEAIIHKANEHVNLVEENRFLRQEIGCGVPVGRKNTNVVIAHSPVMKKIIAQLDKVAQSNASVFISGESGTGKEVISSYIHSHSLRANKPFIRVNCAAIPDTLVESEFFGHEKGSFTGANTKRLGRFELANGGSLLLDEITEIPFNLQAKLLRVIQEQEFDRVGGVKPVQVDVRLISTSNRHMEDAIADKIFREDLFYRLNVVPVHLPPLRERTLDIVPLAEHFLYNACIDNHKKQKTLLQSAKDALEAYHWPGNIRELANLIERAVVLDAGDVVEAEHLQLDRKKDAVESAPRADIGADFEGTIQELERRLILETLRRHDQNRTKAAKSLGISIRTLRNKLHEYAQVDAV